MGSGTETSKLYKVDGWYYHMYSEHIPGRGRHLMMQRAKSIKGPYEEKRQLCHAQPKSNEPNQGSLAQTPNGTWVFLTPHGMGAWEGRCVSLLPVTWIDGWPVTGEPGPDGTGDMVWSSKSQIRHMAKALPCRQVMTSEAPSLGHNGNRTTSLALCIGPSPSG
jgi:beta-xylosidase